MNEKYVKKEYSDYTVGESASFQCKKCKLSVDEKYRSTEEICKGCANYSKVILLSNFAMSVATRGILIIVLMWLTPIIIPSLAVIRTYIWFVLALAIAPFLIVSLFSVNIHSFGIRSSDRQNLYIAGYTLSNSNFMYYDKALRMWEANALEYPETYRDNVLTNMMMYLLVLPGDSPWGIFDSWAEPLDLTGQELFESMFKKHKDLVSYGLRPTVHFGFLDQVWKYALEGDLEMKQEILKQLEEYAADLDSYDPFAAQVFRDELFANSDTITAEIEGSDDYPTLQELIANYQTPDLPKNQLNMLSMSSMEAQRIQEGQLRAMRKEASTPSADQNQ